MHFKKAFLLIIFQLLLVGGFNPSYGGELFTGKNIIKKGLSLSYQFRIKEAVTIFKELEKEHPESHASRFYPPAMQWGYIEEEIRWGELAKLFAKSSPPKNGNKKLVQKIIADMESVIEECKTTIANEPSNFEANFYLAGAYGLTARAELYRKNPFSALSAGKRAAKQFDALIKEHPKSADAMLGAGAYRQDLARLAIPLRFIIALYGLEADMEKGIGLLEKAYQLSDISKIESADILADIFISYKKDYQKGLIWAGRLEDEAPNSFLADLHKVKAYRKIGDKKKVEESLKTILQKIENYPERLKNRWEPLIHFALGVIANEAGDKDRASKHFKKAESNGKAGNWLKNEIKAIR